MVHPWACDPDGPEEGRPWACDDCGRDVKLKEKC